MEEKTPATVDTVYRVGSITRAFTGLMLLQLVQDGKASLSDPVDRYFPELGRIPNRPAARMTLEQLAKLSWDAAHQGSGYGIGMQVRRTDYLVVFGHDGDVPGYVANVRFDRASKTGVIMLRSADGGRFDRRELTCRALEEIARP